MKFNSLICTSREQSERLLALGLRKETADFPVWGTEKLLYMGWSLHRLIEIMPTTIKSRYGYVNLAVNAELVQYQYYDEDYMHNECCQHFNDGTLYDNIIDCIEWLIKEGYFNNKYLCEK